MNAATAIISSVCAFPEWIMAVSLYRKVDVV